MRVPAAALGGFGGVPGGPWVWACAVTRSEVASDFIFDDGGAEDLLLRAFMNH